MITRLHRWYAFVFGYAWGPCPLCGREFGGHQWKDRKGKISRIPVTPGTFRAICPACTIAGKGRES